MVVNILDVKRHIMEDNIQSYYIFAGEEIEAQRIYIEKIAQKTGYRVLRAERLSDVWSSIVTPSLFDTPAVYVIRDDKDMLSDDFQEQIARCDLNDNIIICLITSIDKRTKWYKANSDKIVVFEHFDTEMLVTHIQARVTLNKRNCERLIAICENDYSRILLEIDKLQRYMLAKEISYKNANSVFEQLVSEGAIYVPPDDAVFDLAVAILYREIHATYDLYEQCKEIGESNLVILSVLYTNTKQVLQVQACESKNIKDICASTGLTQWQVKHAQPKCGRYSNGELVNIMRLIQNIKKGIITGKIDESISVDFLLANIL